MKILNIITLITTLISSVFGGIFGGVVVKPADGRINDTETIIVASYNTAAPWGNVLEGTGSSKRAKLFAQQINDHMPDSLGTQELNSYWVEDMEKYLPQYAYYGVKRGGDENEKKSEINGIYYLKDKFELLECDTFWISNTPDVESKFDGAGCNRICSYVVLKNKMTGKIYAHLNTHFDNVSVPAQNLGGELLLQKSNELKSVYGDISVVITGDFNQYSSGASCQILINNGFVNASSVVPNGDNMLTYNGWTTDTVGRPIDFIFTNNGFTTMSYEVVTNAGADVNVSDHYMIKATLNINEFEAFVKKGAEIISVF